MEKIEQMREEERGNENYRRKLQIQKKTRGVITKDQRGVRYNGSVPMVSSHIKIITIKKLINLLHTSFKNPKIILLLLRRNRHILQF